MRLIQKDELENINGGILPAIAAGIAGAYIYEAIGGKKGIDEYFANGWASTKSSINYWFR